MEIRYENLTKECTRITGELQHALALRELCCADFDRARRWLQEAEVQVAPESAYSSSSVADLELQLQESRIDDSVVFNCRIHLLYPFFRIIVHIHTMLYAVFFLSKTPHYVTFIVRIVGGIVL